jgi:hypothetical protein
LAEPADLAGELAALTHAASHADLPGLVHAASGVLARVGSGGAMADAVAPAPLSEADAAMSSPSLFRCVSGVDLLADADSVAGSSPAARDSTGRHFEADGGADGGADRFLSVASGGSGEASVGSMHRGSVDMLAVTADMLKMCVFMRTAPHHTRSASAPQPIGPLGT